MPRGFYAGKVPLYEGLTTNPLLSTAGIVLAGIYPFYDTGNMLSNMGQWIRVLEFVVCTII